MLKYNYFNMKKIIGEVSRFVVVCVGSNVVNYFTYVLMYTLIGVPLWIAAAAGYIVGLMNSFYFGKLWVFNHGSSIHRLAIIKFILVYGIGGIGMTVIINELDSNTILDYRLIWFFGALFAFFNNYLGSKWLVFFKVDNNHGN